MGRSKKVKERFKNGSDPEAATEKIAVSEIFQENVHDGALFRKEKTSWLMLFCEPSFTHNLFLRLATTDQMFRFFNLFVPNAPFLYPLKILENLVVFCFQEVEKGCIRNEWVNIT